ncbi:hypothetical protein CCACVL1_24896 [Corchorus capsularis]|uniref:F-box associated beta-propeller type 3 domain-containing protein n=1 Tax=Corchorus capsularis TaxID=210143 RepID=A0A1R3GMT2_COCAP|nr:hypothetical protein CCACVL1_24896 [Corchorus capsularis]
MAALPLKSIFRFRCLSKSWQGFLTSPCLADMHLNDHQTKTKTKSQVLIVSSGNSFRLIKEIESPTKPDFPLQLEFTEERDVLGSCNGLLLVAVHGEDKGMKLWNLTTGECQKLPPSCPSSNDVKGTFGFGYDKSTNDFKVITFGYVDDSNYLLDDIERVVQIYSLRSNTWKRIKGFPLSISFTDQTKSGTLVDGVIYWTVKSPSLGKCVLGFNLKSEKFEKSRLPNDVYGQGDSLLGLWVIEGCLSLAENHNGAIDIWKLERDENSTWQSWIKITLIMNLKELECRKCWLPHCIMNNGEILLTYFNDWVFPFYDWNFLRQDDSNPMDFHQTIRIVQTEGFQLYDPVQGRIRRLDVGDMKQCRQAITYVKSPVSPKVVGNESNPKLQLEAKEFIDLYGKDWSQTF